MAQGCRACAAGRECGGAGPAKGGLYENFVAGALQRKGYPLYYYKTLDGSREVEFVIEKDGGVIPIEVKATNGATVSLNEPRNRLTPLHSFGCDFLR